MLEDNFFYSSFVTLNNLGSFFYGVQGFNGSVPTYLPTSCRFRQIVTYNGSCSAGDSLIIFFYVRIVVKRESTF